MSAEYNLAMEQGGLSVSELQQVATASMKAAFCSDAVTETIIREHTKPGFETQLQVSL